MNIKFILRHKGTIFFPISQIESTILVNFGIIFYNFCFYVFFFVPLQAFRIRTFKTSKTSKTLKTFNYEC